MNGEWKPSALRAAGDIDRQAADDIEFGVTISTRDGRQLVHEWHAALARAERAEAALRTMAEQKEFFRVCWEEAEAELAERDKPCVWTELPRFVPQMQRRWTVGCSAPEWIDHAPSEFRFCPVCGHPVQRAPSDNDLLSDGLEEK